MLGAPSGTAAEASASGGEASFLVLQKGGKRPPFFAGGSHPRYRELARRLGHDQPVYQLDIYALQSQRLFPGLPASESVERSEGGRVGDECGRAGRSWWGASQ